MTKQRLYGVGRTRFKTTLIKPTFNLIFPRFAHFIKFLLHRRKTRPRGTSYSAVRDTLRSYISLEL